MKIQRYHVNPAGGVYRFNDGAYMLFTDHERDKAEAVAAVAKKTAELREELVAVLVERACLQSAKRHGWYSVTSNTLLAGYAERLVSLGVWERGPVDHEHYRGYRPIQKGPTDATQDTNSVAKEPPCEPKK